MQTYAKLPKAELTQNFFGAGYQFETFVCYFRSIGQTRGEAGGRGAIPGGQSCALREFADFRFVQRRFEQRRDYVMLGCGAMSRAEIQSVVGVYAVGYRSEILLEGQGVEHVE